MSKPIRQADCHPEKRHVAKGLCKACYSLARRKANPDWVIKAREYHNAAKAAHPEKYLSGGKYRVTQRDAKFNLKPGQYDEILEKQNYRCAVCQRHQDEFTRALSVDHDHACCSGEKSCGKCIRGLLCFNCNSALGKLNDDFDRIMSLASYILSFQNTFDMLGE